MKISTIIPVYGATEFLLDAIRSVKAITSVENEILVVDDGNSINETIAALDRVDHIPGVKLVRLQKNAGLAHARNAGFERATGDYVRFLDHDDFLAAAGAEKQYAMAKETGAPIVVANFLFCDKLAEKTWTLPDNTPNALKDTSAFESFLYLWERGFSVPIHSTIFNRKVLKNLLQVPFPTGFRAKEDWVFGCSLAMNGLDFQFLDEVVCFYRQHGNNMCRDIESMSRSFLEASNAIAKRLEGISLDNSKFMSQSLDHFYSYYVNVIKVRAVQERSTQ